MIYNSKNKVQKVTVRDFRSNMAPLLNNLNPLEGGPSKTILEVGKSREHGPVYVMTDTELLAQHKIYAEYQHIYDFIKALDLSSFRTISTGYFTETLPIAMITALTSLFGLIPEILSMTYTEGPSFTYNNINALDYLQKRPSKPERRLNLLYPVSSTFLNVDTGGTDSLSLGLFIKHMRDGFTIETIFSQNRQIPEIANTFNDVVKLLPPGQQQTIDKAIQAFQGVLMQPREKRIANEPYTTHVKNHLYLLTEWYDEHIANPKHKPQWVHNGFWQYK